jgi:hypothetical protein
VNGLRLMALGFIAVLPFILLIGLGYFLMFAPMLFEAFSSPSFGEDTLSPWMFTPMLGMFGVMFTMGLSVLLMMLIGVFFPAAMSHMIAEDRFSAAFRVKDWWPIFKANIWGYIIAHVLLLGTVYLTMFAVQLAYMTVVLCCLIPFISSFVGIYLGFFLGAVFGQTYRVGRQKSGLDTQTDEKEKKGK